MARYWMLEACAFMDNGEALYYRTIPKDPVEISDEVAATLGDKVRRVDPLPEPEKVRPEGTEGQTGDALDGLLTVNEIRELEGLEPENSEPPKPKRKRKVEEEEPDGDKEL